jgi:hypothetical protein
MEQTANSNSIAERDYERPLERGLFGDGPAPDPSRNGKEQAFEQVTPDDQRDLKSNPDN